MSTKDGAYRGAAYRSEQQQADDARIRRDAVICIAAISLEVELGAHGFCNVIDAFGLVDDLLELLLDGEQVDEIRQVEEWIDENEEILPVWKPSI